MTSIELQSAREQLEQGLQSLFSSLDEYDFIHGAELLNEVIKSTSGNESMIARNIALTCLSKVIDSTLAHLANNRQPSDDFLSAIMRTFWQISEINLPLGFDFMEIWSEMFSVSLDAGLHMKVSEKERGRLKQYLNRIHEEMLRARTDN